MKKAVILLSGGLDSATTLAIANRQGYEAHALSFDYGQRQKQELECARNVAASFGVQDHRIATIDLRLFGGSALTDTIDVPKDRKLDDSIPITYVPARNTIFLSFALAFAEVIGAHDIFIGVNALDYSGYPDCRPKYIEAFQAMAKLATKEQNIHIHTPLIHLTKAQIIEKGVKLGVNYALTLSCYDPEAGHKHIRACGHCDACQLRLKGFAESGIKDPASYV